MTDFPETKEIVTYFLFGERHIACKGGGITRVKNRSQNSIQKKSTGSFLLFRLHQNLMKAREIISDRVIPLAPKGSRRNPKGRDLPVHFSIDTARAFEIKNCNHECL
jgi:hypothetical protein